MATQANVDGRVKLSYQELSEMEKACRFGKKKRVEAILDSFPLDPNESPWLDVNTIEIGVSLCGLQNPLADNYFCDRLDAFL